MEAYKMNGLKYIRSKVINKTMDELAAKLNVSKQAVYTWESGRKNIPETRLKQISELSGIPEKYFLIEELSERDKLEIKKYRLNKELDDTSVEYEEQVEDRKGNLITVPRVYLDRGLIEHIEFNDMELKVDDTLKKISQIIHAYKPTFGNEDMVSSDDILENLDVKRSVFDRFADIVDGNEERLFLYQILRAMELFFDVNVKKNQIWGEVPSYPTDLVSDESILVQDLYKVLYEHKKQKIEANNEKIKDAEELQRLFRDDTSDDLY